MEGEASTPMDIHKGQARRHFPFKASILPLAPSPGEGQGMATEDKVLLSGMLVDPMAKLFL